MSSGPVQRQETSHLDDPVSPVSETHAAAGAREGGDDDNDGASNAQQDEARSSADDHVQDAKEKGAKPSKREKVKAHFKRFWWAHLIAFIIILAILLPILFKVIIPKIVQSIVNDQKLPITGGALVALSPTSLNMSLDTSLNTPLAAKIQSTKLSLYNKDTEPYSPFMKITLPELNVNHKTETSVVNQTVHIDDLDELIKWFNGVFDEPEVKVSVKGDPTVKLSTLTYHPHLNTDVKVKSLDYLAGFGVNEMEFVLPPKENGFNLKGTLNLPNSGSLELFLGNLTFNMMSGNVNLGYANLYNVDMKPGNNTPYFDGEFFFNELIPNLGTILDAQKEALSRGVIAFNATGNSTTINGEHIMYVEKVLNAKHIPYEIPVTTLLSSLVNGLMGDGKSDLLDLAGDLVGNKTLLDNILEHWNETNPTGNGESIGKKVKRVVPNASLMWNMIRLSNRVKKHEL